MQVTSGRIITYTPSAAGRTLSAVDTANGINYATGALYAPHGALRALTNGSNLVSTFYYNNRLQPCRISVKSSGTAPADCPSPTVGNVMDFTYNFDQDWGAGVKNNGNVASINNNRNLNRGQRFTYDELNRVKDAWTAGSLWGNSYVYDLWGNLNKKLACLATAPCAGYPQGENLDQTANSKNQFVGMSYDAAGNLTNAGAGVMTYDAENRLVAAGGVTYAYLADGNRVRKAGSGVVDTAYWYGPNGELLAESDLSSNIREEYVFFNGRRVARRTAATGAVVYYFSDHLGSASVITNAAGTIVEESDYYPFGGERIIVNNDPNAYKFTGKERDAETGLDYFIARHYSSSLGRFLQPDEFAGGPVDAFSSNDPLPDSPLPYADISNPQSLNKYAYTYNNPLGYVDPDGHDGFTFLGIPVVYNCRPYCAAEWAHEKQHAADYWNRQMTLKDYEKRAFAAEAKVYENRLQELEQKQASGQKLSPEEQKEMNEIKKERLPTAQNNATDKGATDYVKNTNPGTDPNSTLWNPQPAKQDQQQQNQQQQQQQQKQQQQQQEEKKKKGNRK